ncbi:MAG TPA: TolC family protein [Smithellaceae bacterium]|nr:TolC family protein [Smithellaceae bacterium]
MRKAVFYGIVLFAALTALVCTAAAREYTLCDLYHHALKISEKIKYAEENLYIAKTGKDKAWSVLIPKLTAYGTYNQYSEKKYGNSSSSSGPTLIQPDNSANWGVRADETFSLSARELNALKYAGQNITKNEYDLDATKSDFVLAIAFAYYDTLKAKKSLEVAAANMERLTQYRDSVAKRVKVGELTRTALLRADGELSGARSEYLRATNSFKSARATLSRIVVIEDDFRLKETTLPIEEDVDFNKLRDAVADTRSDLKSYEIQKKMAAEQVKYARGAFWPNVGLFAVYSGYDQDPVTSTTNKESVLAGVAVTFPFFEGGLRIADYREAKAKERQAKLAYDEFKKIVDIELQNAYLDLQTEQGTLKFLEDQLIFAEDNFNAVIRMFNNGLATSLDVMDANSLLLSAEKNANEARYNYQLANLRVKRTSGTLLQFINTCK